MQWVDELQHHIIEGSLAMDSLLLTTDDALIRKELEAAIDACQEGIYICDEHLRCLRVNRAYERITGLPGSRLIGKTSAQLEREGVIKNAVGPIVFEKKEEVSLIQIFPSTGKKVLVTGKPVFEQGKLFRIVITARDLTELNKIETKLKAAEERSQRYFQELSQIKHQQKNQRVVAVSTKMKQIIELIPKISAFDSPVLVQGESGTGKEVISKLIHDSSKRANRPFVKVNCGAIPEELLESELFGYVKGAFTGADSKGKKGLFEAADNGTLFLDEIGEMPLKLQVKLLRVLQDFMITPVGSTTPYKVNVRIICATNKPLMEMVQKGKFREDLFYRINVIPIHIPPLRERKSDIQPIVQLMLDSLKSKYNIGKTCSLDVLDMLEHYYWPGNIRELQNLIERLFIMTSEDVIEVPHLPQNIISQRINIPTITKGDLKKLIQNFEKKVIEDTIKETKSFRQASKKLGINPSTLTRKCQKYEIKNEF
jgi:PAS domain S-box-containing protein